MESRREIISMLRPVLALAALALVAGCQTAKPLYHWGHYEPLAYQAHVKPDKAPVALQIEKLEEDLQKAAAANLPPHPGLHAHLGYLYFTIGRLDDAMKHFEAEKRLFPESATFIDTLLKSAKPAGAAPAAPATPAQPTPAKS